MGNNEKYWIIDGQQRLTTAVIFLSCIHNRLSGLPEKEKEAKNLFHEYLLSTDGQQKFQTVEYDNNFFLNAVIEGREDKIDTRSRRRIFEAKEFFSERVQKATLEKILCWKELVENAKITTDIVNDKAEATQLFTFQNDRGKDLTNLEKLKAFLMLHVYLNSKSTGLNPNDAITFIEKEFETIYKALEKISIADEDQVLNYHTIAFMANADTAIDRIKATLSKKQKEDQLKWIKDFVISLKRSFEYVITIQNKLDTYSFIGDILLLDQANSFPLLLKLYHFHEKHDKIESVIRLIEIILFRLKYTSGNYYSNYLPSIAYQYLGTNIEGLKSTLRHHAQKGFKGYWNFERDFYKCLEGDYHYWPISRYLLWKYENSLRGEAREPFMLYSEFRNLYGTHKLENTIDHWTPQNPYGVEYEEIFKEKYLNNIGNLVLATRGRNSSDSNNLPSERSTYSVLISRQRLENHKEDWGKEHIKERQNEIVSFAKKYWNPENV